MAAAVPKSHGMPNKVPYFEFFPIPNNTLKKIFVDLQDIFLNSKFDVYAIFHIHAP